MDFSNKQKLEMEIFPAVGLGPFVLGMPIRNAIEIIQQQQSLILHFELKYCKENPLASDILLDLVDDGLLLRFNPISQRLGSIEIYETKKLDIAYGNTIFCSGRVNPTFDQVYKAFGPTHPGSFDSRVNVYQLSYPGLHFEFNASRVTPESIAELPLVNHDGSSPCTTRITVVPGGKTATTHDVSRDVVILFDKGVQIGDDLLTFESSVQDVLSLLGQPCRIYTKGDDKLQIHAKTLTKTPMADYFYNYFDLGLDVLFDSQRHTIKKLILHTNTPHHHEFNRYAKCHLKLRLNDDDAWISADDRFDQIAAREPAEFDSPIVQMSPFGVLLFYGYRNVIFEVVKTNQYVASICVFAPDQ